jgi:hypothetical protein
MSCTRDPVMVGRKCSDCELKLVDVNYQLICGDRVTEVRNFLNRL